MISKGCTPPEHAGRPLAWRARRARVGSQLAGNWLRGWGHSLLGTGKRRSTQATRSPDGLPRAGVYQPDTPGAEGARAAGPNTRCPTHHPTSTPESRRRRDPPQPKRYEGKRAIVRRAHTAPTHPAATRTHAPSPLQPTTRTQGTQGSHLKKTSWGKPRTDALPTTHPEHSSSQPREGLALEGALASSYASSPLPRARHSPHSARRTATTVRRGGERPARDPRAA